MQTLLGKDDIVISDELNHASIIDAVRVAGVKNKFAYAHSDMTDLESKLAAASELQKRPKPNGEHPLILVVTDGVFSMDGDLAPLPKIVELAKKYDALTMVDDAHGEGVLGKGGNQSGSHAAPTAPSAWPHAVPTAPSLHGHTQRAQLPVRSVRCAPPLRSRASRCACRRRARRRQPLWARGHRRHRDRLPLQGEHAPRACHAHVYVHPAVTHACGSAPSPR